MVYKSANFVAELAKKALEHSAEPNMKKANVSSGQVSGNFVESLRQYVDGCEKDMRACGNHFKFSEANVSSSLFWSDTER